MVSQEYNNYRKDRKKRKEEIVRFIAEKLFAQQSRDARFCVSTNKSRNFKMKKNIIIFLCTSISILLIYASAYISLRKYKAESTANSTFGTKGVVYFTYFNEKYINIYPLTKNDAKMQSLLGKIGLIDKRSSLLIFVPAEKAELYIRGKTHVKLSKQEEADITNGKDEDTREALKYLPY